MNRGTAKPDDSARAAPIDSGRRAAGAPRTARLPGQAQVDRVAAGGMATPLLARDWLLIAPCMALALVLIGLVSRTMPEPGTMIMTVAAMAIVAASPLLLRVERRHIGNLPTRYALMLAGVAMPMALFGAALAGWAGRTEAIDWRIAVAVLVVVGLVSGTLLNGRLASAVTAQIALWYGVAFALDANGHLAVLALGLPATFVLARRQFMAEADADARQREIWRARHRAEMLLGEYERSGQGWFWETDRRGIITYVSPTVEKLVRRTGGSLIGQPFTNLFVLDAQGGGRERTLNFHLSVRSAFREIAVRAATDEAEPRWWSISGHPVHDEFRNFQGFRGSGSDLTEKKRSQENASRLALFDSLTGLANRVQMSDMLEKILNARQEDRRACAVFLLDLDRFKQVNDTLGHPAGDALLKQVAQRIERVIDKAGRVGRLGGDEFKVVIPGDMERERLAQLARRVIESLSQPYSIEGHRVVIGASVGIALSPDDGATSEALIRNADLALYAAKDGGRGRHHFYAPDLHSDAEERRRLEQDLRDAIASGGLELYYQPVVRTASETITGFEALLRWNHPVHGPMSPAKFVPIAEDAGLIALIGEWALRTACRDLARWPDSVRVAVNVSPLQFANPSLPAIVTSALAAAQVDPGRLELEITESVFLNESSSTDAMFAALKRVGVRLALDDFGTGYSSLGYLKKAPFDKIKIDQSFVRGATVSGSRNGAIIESIVSLAEALDMETTAEGVETLDELDLVRTLGCSHVQGFIYERPLSPEAAEARLKAGLTATASGPRSARAPRQTMLRKVELEHANERYTGTIRNISTSGAMIEGLWNVPVDTVFTLHYSRDFAFSVTTRWSAEDRMGVQFAHPLALDAHGGIVATALPAGDGQPPVLLRKAG